jgi:hypothetical protein
LSRCCTVVGLPTTALTISPNRMPGRPFNVLMTASSADAEAAITVSRLGGFRLALSAGPDPGRSRARVGTLAYLVPLNNAALIWARTD